MRQVTKEELTENHPMIKALRLTFALKPWGRDRISHMVAKYFDGDEHALDSVPELKKAVDQVFAECRAWEAGE